MAHCTDQKRCLAGKPAESKAAISAKADKLVASEGAFRWPHHVGAVSVGD